MYKPQYDYTKLESFEMGRHLHVFFILVRSHRCRGQIGQELRPHSHGPLLPRPRRPLRLRNGDSIALKNCLKLRLKNLLKVTFSKDISLNM